MHRPWTRSMPSPPEDNFAQMGNNFTQGQTSQQSNDSAFSQVCRLYEQSQQQQQEMMQHLINMGNHQGQHQPRSKLSELQRTNPTIFSHTDKPLEADDWLRDIERKLVIAQCTDQEKVLYAPHYFSGRVASWWENLCHTHPNGEDITWEQFKEGFPGAHIPNSIMKLKKQEFEDLKQ